MSGKVPTRLERVFQDPAGRKKIEFSASESYVLTSYTMEPLSAPEAYRSPDPTLFRTNLRYKASALPTELLERLLLSRDYSLSHPDALT